MALHFDHVVILVSDLAEAAEDYTGLGFNVIPGGRHANGLTHNALIAFEDGSYLELLAFLGGLTTLGEVEPEPATFLHRVKMRAQDGNEGIVEFMLRSDDLEQTVEALRQSGIEVDGPTTGGRTRPDGEEMRWLSGAPHPAVLPFLIADVTPRSLRVPEGADTHHPNGVTGVLRLVFAAQDLAEADRVYSTLLGRDPLDGEAAGPTADFLLEGTAIRLVPSHNGMDHPLSLALLTEDPRAVGQLDINRAHGAPIELLAE